MASTWLVVGLGNPGPVMRPHGTTSARWWSTSWPRDAARRSASTRGVARGRRDVVAPRGGQAGAGQAEHLHERLRHARGGSGPVLLGPCRAGDRGARRARHPVRHGQAQDQGAVTADTTACAMSHVPWAPPTSRACGVGIGRPVGRQDPADWVLAPFGKEERPNLPILIADAADAVELLVGEGLLAAQQKHHAPR